VSGEPGQAPPRIIAELVKLAKQMRDAAQRHTQTID